MDMAGCRLSGLKIHGYKNVRYGEVSFDGSRRKGSSIQGIYGQNGSGKTAVIEAIEILSIMLRERDIPREFIDLINVYSSEACFSYTLRSLDDSSFHEAVYELHIREALDESGNRYPEVYREVLTFDDRESFDSDSIPTLPIVLMKDSSDSRLFFQFFNTWRHHSRSILFAKFLRDALDSDDFIFFRECISQLRYYGLYNLIVIPDMYISSDVITLRYKSIIDGEYSFSKSELPIKGRFPYPEIYLGRIDVFTERVNKVLDRMIPGLKLGVRNYGKNEEKEYGRGWVDVELMSLKNGKAIPLAAESEGIRRLVVIADLLISVFMDDSVTLVIDGFDSGFSEYLWKEMLKIISEHGHGQLIFTADNLSVLECLTVQNITFTTINPNNRYLRMRYVNTNDNLRDLYLREIVMDEQMQSLYDYVNSAEIVFSLMDAGDDLRSGIKNRNILNLIKYHAEYNELGFSNEVYKIAKQFDQAGDFHLSEYIMALISDANRFIPQ